METDLIIGRFKENFDPEIIEVNKKSEKRVTISIRPDAILRVAEYLYKNAGFRFIISSALHTKKGFEILYHFSMDVSGLVLNIHVLLERENPQVESLSNMFSASNWIEREMHELFGINFINHPNQEKLISDGNWAEGIYPYRKEFK